MEAGEGLRIAGRFQTDPITHSKKVEYLGKHKPTERIYADFQREHANLDGQIDALQRRMDVAALGARHSVSAACRHRPPMLS